MVGSLLEKSYYLRFLLYHAKEAKLYNYMPLVDAEEFAKFS